MCQCNKSGLVDLGFGSGLAGLSASELSEELQAARRVLLEGRLANLKPVLPIMLNLKGEPYKLLDHFPFEPFFSTHTPRNLCLKCGRQTSKSTSGAAKHVLRSSSIAYFNTLYVTPLYEMTRRFSSNYVRGFIEESPVRSLFVDQACYNNVLQRSFKTHSTIHFSFAFLDADRTRGLNCDCIHYDEVQDLDPAFIPIIRETMSGSKNWGIQEFSGTPKTLDNTLETQWQMSSQAEWCIRCEACGYWNIPCMSHDLDKMMGPITVPDDISEERPGTCCAKCERVIFPRRGRWVHAHPELRFEYSGYHVPQLLLPMHYASHDKWAILQGKRQGFGNTPTNVFYNEVCGESYDIGAKLVTITDLKRAAILGPNGEVERIRKNRNDYIHRILAVDWGGGGEKEISFTVAALCCMLPDGTIHVPFGWRSLTPHDHNLEASVILKLCAEFHCSHIAHDYTGAGAIRETLFVNSGYPIKRIIPVALFRAAAGPIMRRIPQNRRTLQREHYRLDKSRSLLQTCFLIKFGRLKFFQYDYKGVEQRGLLHDFLSLMEDEVQSATGTPIHTVIQSEQVGPDDFAQAVNIGTCALFYRARRWPNLAEVSRLAADPEALKAVHPLRGVDWSDRA
jgi:hypothetical protein